MMKKNDRYREAQKEIGKVLKKKGSVTFEDFLAQYGDYPINPHLHTTKQLNKMTKKGLIRLVVKLEKFIVKVAYQMYKSKLPRLKTIKRKALPYNGRIDKRRKKKRKFSRKQLAAQRLFAKRARAGTLRRR